jgi:hypothetical protein
MKTWSGNTSAPAWVILRRFQIHAAIASRDQSPDRGRPCIRPAALEFGQKRPVDQLDKDATVANSFDRIGDLDQLAGGLFEIGVGRSTANFIGPVFNAPSGEASTVPCGLSHPRACIVVICVPIAKQGEND